MRFALIVAPGDPQSSDGPTGSEAIAWLGAALARLDFQVEVLDGGEDFEGRLARTLLNVSPSDTLFVHVSGRLARRGVLRTSSGAWLPLRKIGETLRGCAGAHISILAELVNEDHPQDARFAGEHVSSILGAFGAREYGYGAVAAVRSSLWPVDRFAFTRLFVGVAGAGRREGALMSTTYQRVMAMPERLLTTQGLGYERGAVDLDLAPAAPAVEELDVLIADATDRRDWRRAVDLRRARLVQHESRRARVRELVCIARILQSELIDAEGAVEALEEARGIDPTRIPVLQALRRGYERLGRWASAIEVVGALAGLAETRSDRAELHFAQARIAIDRLQDDDRAIAWLEATLEDEPMHERARAALNEVLALRSVPDDMDGYEIEPDEIEASVGLAEEIDSNELRSDETPPAARTESGGEPGTDESSTAEEDEHADSGRVPAPLDSEEPTSRLPPPEAVMAAISYARTFAARQSEGRTDRAFLQALSLEELEAANVDQQILIAELRSVAPIRARGTLDESGWALLRAPGSDPAMEALFASIARAALEDRLTQLEARGRLMKLDPVRRFESSSTAVVARTFQWASRVLGVACPELYVVDQVPGDIAAVRAREASTAVSPSIVRGRSPKDLAFLAGRHLAYYRPEHEVIGYYPTREELITLLFAAVQVVRPSASPPGGSTDVSDLSARLVRIVTDAERAAISSAVRLLRSQGGKASVGMWTRGVELTAARAGLFLCGDLATAMARLRAESRDFGGLTIEEKRQDLVDFCASEAHATLRARFAVTAGEAGRVGPPLRATLASDAGLDVSAAAHK